MSITIIAKVKPTSWFEFCSPCEVPWHVYRSIESSGNKHRTFIRMFERPMAERFARNVMRKNDQPKGRWVTIYRMVDHAEHSFYQTY